MSTHKNLDANSNAMRSTFGGVNDGNQNVPNRNLMDVEDAQTSTISSGGFQPRYLLQNLNLTSVIIMDVDNKYYNVGLLIVATLLVAKLISALIMPRSSKRLPHVVNGWPVIGGLLRFLKGPIVMLREEYPKLGSVFTVPLVNRKITFLIGPEVSAHFFKAPETDLSQQEVYQFNMPTFGPGVVFDVDYSIRQEQSLFFTEALRVNKLKSYVD
ncbi:hypothetical protein Q3G72_024822 [Acer saccharum]|nr:hypothetical protein Q3G72_024822 [Acer saccharum]